MNTNSELRDLTDDEVDAAAGARPTWIEWFGGDDEAAVSPGGSCRGVPIPYP